MVGTEDIAVEQLGKGVNVVVVIVVQQRAKEVEEKVMEVEV